jgi:hypothetical protein
VGRTFVSLVRCLVACALLTSVAGVTGLGRAQAGAAKLNTYKNTALHYSLQYPAGWAINAKLNSKGVGAIEATINSVALALASPDNAARFLVLVKTSATDGAKIKSNIAGMLKEGASLIGQVQFGTVKVKGITFVSGWATEKVSPTLTAYGYIDGVSQGNFTYYAGGAYLLKQANSGSDYAAMQGIMASLTLR